MTKNQETRKMAVDMEIRKADLDAQDENLTVTGYAVVFNKPAVMWHDPYDDTNYYEVIDEKALDEADLSDVVMRYNHNDSSEILARTSNQTLNLIKDDSGLKIIAQLANTSFGRDVYELIKRKDISQMSFAFTVPYDGEDYDENTHTRRITKIDKVYDVSAVDVPAYDGTSIEAMARGVKHAAEEYKKEAEMRKRIQILTGGTEK